MIILIFRNEEEKDKIFREKHPASLFSYLKCSGKEIRIKKTSQFFRSKLRNSERLLKLLKLKIETVVQ
jgi:hypothetical protein